MSHRIVGQITRAAIVLAFAVGPALAQPASPSVQSPAVPSGLEVPAGNDLFLAAYAEGTQNYVCLLLSKGFSWRFLGPQATLFDIVNGEERTQVMTHFLSVNPADALARPTWQHSSDSSRVWGRLRASSIDPAFVEPGAIPWLLLEAAGTQFGAENDVLAQTTFIQRLNTSGGLAPSAGCSKSADVGVMALVPYTTEYYFYKAAPEM
jgi:hypothetical protein